MKLLSKIKFYLKKTKLIIVTGEGRTCAKEAISQVLRENY